MPFVTEIFQLHNKLRIKLFQSIWTKFYKVSRENSAAVQYSKVLPNVREIFVTSTQIQKQEERKKKRSRAQCRSVFWCWPLRWPPRPVRLSASPAFTQRPLLVLRPVCLTRWLIMVSVLFFPRLFCPGSVAARASPLVHSSLSSHTHLSLALLLLSLYLSLRPCLCQSTNTPPPSLAHTNLHKGPEIKALNNDLYLQGSEVYFNAGARVVGTNQIVDALDALNASATSLVGSSGPAAMAVVSTNIGEWLLSDEGGR